MLTTSAFRSRRILYIPHTRFYFLVFIIVLSLTLSLLFLGVVGTAFKTLFPNLGTTGTLILLTSCLIGSYINIPITRIKSKNPIIWMRRVRVFGVTYYAPMIVAGVNEMLLAINVGGAVIPLVASIYLISRVPQILVDAVLAIILVAVIVRLVSRPVRGIGIVSPSLIPPLSAALSAVFLGGEYTYVIAYVSGTIGTLIGADLLNVKVFSTIGSPIISIGGAGTFDGIFLSGIMAVLIA